MPTEGETNELIDLTRQLISAEGQGVLGYLRQGELLTRLAEVTGGMAPPAAVRLQQTTYDQEAGLGRDGKSKFPGEAQRSNLRATYRSWCVDAGLGYQDVVQHPDFPRPMSLATVRNFSALRSLNGAVERGNIGKLLAFLHSYPWKVVSRVARHINTENAGQLIDSFRGRTDEEIIAWGDRLGGRPEPEIKSFRVPTPVYERYVSETVPRVAATVARVAPTGTLTPWPPTQEGVRAEAADASRTVVFELLLHAADTLSPEWWEGVVRDAYGAHDEASYNRWVNMNPFQFVQPEVN